MSERSHAVCGASIQVEGAMDGWDATAISGVSESEYSGIIMMRYKIDKNFEIWIFECYVIREFS